MMNYSKNVMEGFLAEFLKISRPTLYKFINLYEIGQKDNIDGKILKFFEKYFGIFNNSIDINDVNEELKVAEKIEKYEE